MSDLVRTAVVLVGGQGTRLASRFPDIIKPLVPIAGRPFLDRHLEYLEKQGFQRIILISAYRPEQIDEFLKSRRPTRLKIEHVIEPFPRGTGGALRFALSHLATEPAFVLLNGDTFFDGSLQNIMQTPLSKEIPVIVGVAHVEDSQRFGAIEFDSNKIITHFREKAVAGSGFVNAGVYLIRTEILKEIPENRNCSLEKDFFSRLSSLKVEILNGNFYDIGIPESYDEFNLKIQDLEKRKS